MADPLRGYVATPALELELARRGQAALEGGRYRGTVAAAGKGYYEAWTDTLPFVYGRGSSTLQDALDSLEERYREAEARRRAS